MPVLQTISFDDTQTVQRPELKRITFEEFYEVGRYQFKSLTFEGEGIPLRLTVTNKAGNAIAGAICKVVSVDFEQEGTTSAGGIVALDYKLAQVNTLTIKKTGYQTYTKSFQFDIFKEIDWEISLQKQITEFFTLINDETLINTNPAEPENNILA